MSAVSPIGVLGLSETGFVAACLEAKGVPYYYGGDGVWPVGRPGFDCENFMRRCLGRAGVLSLRVPDRVAADWVSRCQPVGVGAQGPGCVAFYGDGTKVSHVVVVLTGPVPELGGHSYIIGANHGGRKTLGNDPKAKVDVQPATWWKSGFMGYARPVIAEDLAGSTDKGALQLMLLARAGRALTSDMAAFVRRWFAV